MESRLPLRLPSYIVPAEHKDEEATGVGATSVGTAQNCYYSNIANGGTIMSKSITLTKRCLVVVVTIVVYNSTEKRTDIQRGGVNKTKETVMSAANFVGDAYGVYASLQYATEVLDSGTHTYALVNTSGATASFYGRVMKIVAVGV